MAGNTEVTLMKAADISSVLSHDHLVKNTRLHGDQTSHTSSRVSMETRHHTRAHVSPWRPDITHKLTCLHGDQTSHTSSHVSMETRDHTQAHVSPWRPDITHELTRLHGDQTSHTSSHVSMETRHHTPPTSSLPPPTSSSCQPSWQSPPCCPKI